MAWIERDDYDEMRKQLDLRVDLHEIPRDSSGF